MNILKHIFCSLILLALVTSCYDDKGSYNYLTNDQVGVIKIDTVGIKNRLALYADIIPGQHIEFEPNVKYNKMNLVIYTSPAFIQSRPLLSLTEIHLQH